MSLNAERQLQYLWQRGCAFLGTRYAILGGAMTWVSDSDLVSAISNAGGFGVLACGSMTPDLLKKEIQKTKEKTRKPFGVNLIVMHPALDKLVDVTIEEKASHVVLAGGLPSSDMLKKLRDHGIKSIGFAPALVIAKRLIKSGVDALIIEGSEAGGHIGPTSTSVLAQEILSHITEVPIFIAGGIGRGEAIVSYLQMGASGCQLGTRFVCTHECNAHDNFKKAFIKAQARDAQATVQIDPRFPVIPVRALINKATEEFHAFQREMIAKVDRGDIELKEAQLQIEHYWAGSLRKAVIEGDIDHGSLMAGQSVGMVKEIQSVQEVINQLYEQACVHLLRGGDASYHDQMARTHTPLHINEREF